jgi:sec-independent protein translocase protein TatA
MPLSCSKREVRLFEAHFSLDRDDPFGKSHDLDRLVRGQIDKSLSVSLVQNGSANELAIIGYEWLIVLAIIVVLFVWGPQKLPEFARSIGLARKEIEKAYKEASNPTASPVEADPLIETAKKLGISTEGKTRSQISDEIVAKGKASEKPA